MSKETPQYYLYYANDGLVGGEKSDAIVDRSRNFLPSLGGSSTE